jgi:hypothetical protein
MNTMTKEESTALSLPQRAAVALGAAEHEKALQLLVAETSTIVNIKNLDGRTQVHAAFMKLKNARVTITNTGKAAREDATAFSQAVIAEEKRLIRITAAEEDRLQQLRDEWDADREDERQAAIEAERARMEGIRSAIAEIRATPASMMGKSSGEISAKADALRDQVLGDQFAELTAEAQAAILLAGQQLRDMAVKQAEAEAESLRLAAEREELARLRAESEARRAADAKAAADLKAKQDAEAELARQVHEAELVQQRAANERRAAELAKKEAELERRAAAMPPQPTVSIEQPSHAPAMEATRAPPIVVASVPMIKLGAALAAPTLRLGQINERIAPLSISADGLRTLGFEPAGRDKSAILFHESQFQGICAALISHISQVQEQQAA